MLEQLPVLSLMIWIPLLSGILVLLSPGDRMLVWSQRFGVGVSVLVLALSFWLLVAFDSATANFQFAEQAEWIPSLNIGYELGVDGISLPLVVLTSLINLLVLFGSTASIKFRQTQFVAAVLLLTGAMNGVFLAQDSILFYVFWEAMLIPMFLMIGIWGGPNRIYATIKFFLYTFFGSIFMLVALIYMGREAGDFSIRAMQDMPLSSNEQSWIFLAFLIAFAVKIPMVPVHTWLPDAHGEATAPAHLLLAEISCQ